MSPERFDSVVQIAIDTIDALDCDLLVLGEMGIGNTTVAAAIAASLAGGETASWVGRGTGVDDAGLARKREAVQQAQRRIVGITDPIEILREVGGAELAALAAATVAARHRSIASSGIARRNPDTASCSNAWASVPSSTSICDLAKAREPWLPCH